MADGGGAGGQGGTKRVSDICQALDQLGRSATTLRSCP